MSVQAVEAYRPLYFVYSRLTDSGALVASRPPFTPERLLVSFHVCHYKNNFFC
jgi:hypothetical protein